MNREDDALSQLSAVHPPAVAQYNIGILSHQCGQTDNAIRFLTAATHIDPQLQAAGEMLRQLQVSAPNQIANDGILPTPMARTASAAVPGAPYPSTGMTSRRPLPVSFPSETAQVPAGNSPMLLPPVR